MTGQALHYGSLIALTLGALFVFLTLWKNKQLDFDEDAKQQVFSDEKK